MQNRWAEADAAGPDLDGRTCFSHPIGIDPALVLRGGGNTSVKSKAVDVYGASQLVSHVKISGLELVETIGKASGILRRIMDAGGSQVEHRHRYAARKWSVGLSFWARPDCALDQVALTGRGLGGPETGGVVPSWPLAN